RKPLAMLRALLQPFLLINLTIGLTDGSRYDLPFHMRVATQGHRRQSIGPHSSECNHVYRVPTSGGTVPQGKIKGCLHHFAAVEPGRYVPKLGPPFNRPIFLHLREGGKIGIMVQFDDERAVWLVEKN